MELDKQVMNSIQKTTESDITWIINLYALCKPGEYGFVKNITLSHTALR